MSENAGANKIEVFISFANGDKRNHRNREVWKQLTACLMALRAEGVIQDWFSRAIDPDAPDAVAIERLKRSDIIIFALGRNYLDHPERYREVLKNLPESGRYLVFSLLLYPGTWRDSPFARFNLLPPNQKPVAEWGKVEDAFIEIKEAIRQARQAIYPDKSKPRPAPKKQARQPQPSESTGLPETFEEMRPTLGEPPESFDIFPNAFEDTLEEERPRVVAPPRPGVEVQPDPVEPPRPIRKS